jgi:polysaccharide biosynthesis/export protein
MLQGRRVLILTLMAVAIGTPCAAQRDTAGASSTSAANDQVRQDSSRSGFQERNPRYALRKGDSFDVDFAFSPEFNQTVVVQPDGYVTLRGAGSVRVEGETVLELTETIQKAYANILHDPVITVGLKDFEKPYFIAAGQVAKPGKYELRSDLTLVEAVAIAGGFTESSKHSQVLLFRRVSGEMVEARVFNVKQMLGSRNLQEDPHLLAGDMLFVPQSKMSKVRRYLPTSSMGIYANPNPF